MSRVGKWYAVVVIRPSGKALVLAALACERSDDADALLKWFEGRRAAARAASSAD